jgi:hypothetical protein
VLGSGVDDGWADAEADTEELADPDAAGLTPMVGVGRTRTDKTHGTAVPIDRVSI